MWLQTLTDQPLVVLPTALDEQLALLFEQLRRRRCLLVLDNLESILQGGEYAGQFRPEYEEYAQLVQRFGEVEHRSCLLLTSRELPTKVARFERDYSVARTLHLAGVTTALGISILQTVGLYGAAKEMAALVERYSGNPLALKLVAETVVEQYQGDTTFFWNTKRCFLMTFATCLPNNLAGLPKWSGIS